MHEQETCKGCIVYVYENKVLNRIRTRGLSPADGTRCLESLRAECPRQAASAEQASRERRSDAATETRPFTQSHTSIRTHAQGYTQTYLNGLDDIEWYLVSSLWAPQDYFTQGLRRALHVSAYTQRAAAARVAITMA